MGTGCVDRHWFNYQCLSFPHSLCHRPQTSGLRAHSPNIEFYVLDVPTTFNLLLGRPWLHHVKVVSSTLHQMLKYPHEKGVAIVFKNSSIHPLPEVTTLVLEITHGEEDVFLLGFTLAKARVVQTIWLLTRAFRKGEEIRGRARAKQAGKYYELIHRPIRGTLNGHFVQEE
ncbi:hypothetical protein HYC85_029903 [Camellia sinensis]|uniref:Uncharacterized protein n=1 Tax=Camellia sinensis TaxID=4442 RepID=A0A7J7FZ91_CAMSI|nr:hypothetical protein HYC85_029903 [Camellia sinensis]